MRNLFVLIVAFCAMLATPVTAQSSPATEIGRVKNVTPNGVTVQRRGARYSVRAGTKLYEGDIIETSSRGRVGITFIDNTRISVAEKSRMIISAYRFNRRDLGDSTNGADMRVERGRVGVDSGNLSRSGNMRFHTPNSTLGVRGTTFVIEVGS